MSVTRDEFWLSCDSVWMEACSVYPGTHEFHSTHPRHHLSMLTCTPVVLSLLLNRVPWCVPELVCPLSCGWTLSVAVSGDSWWWVRMLAGQLGVSPWAGVVNKLPMQGVFCRTGSFPRVEPSPGRGVWVIYAESVAPDRPDAPVATGHISPLKARHAGSWVSEDWVVTLLWRQEVGGWP